MRHTTDKLKDEVRETLDTLTTLRDEIRVQVHLAGMDAKQRWDELEQDVERVQRAAMDASEKSLHALRDTLLEFQQTLQASREANRHSH